MKPNKKGVLVKKQEYKPVAAVAVIRLPEDIDTGQSVIDLANPDEKAAHFKGSYLLISNRYDAPEQAVDAYAKRWKIEVFYRNAKQELGLTSCHSQSKAAHQAGEEVNGWEGLNPISGLAFINSFANSILRLIVWYVFQTFLRNGRSDNVAGKPFYSVGIWKADRKTAVNVKTGMLSGGHIVNNSETDDFFLLEQLKYSFSKGDKQIIGIWRSKSASES